jgi:chromosome segregation ATPase
LGVNPPSIASRIDTIQKELKEKQAALAQTQAAAAEKEKLMAATKAEMESMQKMVADMDAQQKKAASIKDQVAKATESLQASKTKFAAQLEAAKKSLETLKSPTPESSVIPSGMSVALVSSLQEASQAQAAMRELSTALTETKIRDLEEILKNHDAQIALMQKKLPETDAAMASYATKIKETQDAMPAKQLAFDTAAKLFQEAKAGMDQIGGVVGGIQKGMNRWLAARENSTVVKLQNETEKLKETVEDLKSEIPTIEAEIKTLTDKKAATPPPTPEELAAIDKKLASHAKRIPEAKQELATAEAGLAEKASSHQVALKKYQEMLPK